MKTSFFNQTHNKVERSWLTCSHLKYDDDVEVFVNICPLTRMSPELFSPSIREFTLTHNEAHAYARRRNAWT